MTHKNLLPLAFLLIAVFLSACSPGHIGGNEISFVRDGHLWTIDPDGANAFEVTPNNTPVIGYTWSPDHRIFAFRTLDANFSKTTTGQHISANPVTGLTNDVPSVINTIGIDGGTPIPIAVSSAGLQHSNAWWNPTANRLLYREESTTVIQNAGTQSWWVSQNDQPLDIARQLLPYSYSIPSMASNDMAISNSSQGMFTTTLSGTNLHLILVGNLPGHPLSASLERILWQPAHILPDILYAVSTDSSGIASTVNTSSSIKLILRDTQERTMTIATCSCTQFAWSPDGKSILYSTGTQYTVVNIQDHSSFVVSAESASVPYWSPDSRFIILDGLHTLQLINVTNKRHQELLSDLTSGTYTPQTPLPDSHTLLQPISNSIWASDSRQFLFLTRNRLVWQGKSLDSGKGLYTVSIDDNGRVQGSPEIVDSGNDSQASWIYQDPNTSFIF
ncbi:MAG: TolB family protein [Ktedonobacteraceae bacterium]